MGCSFLPSSSCSSSVGKQSQLLLQPTEVELGLQVGVEFDNMKLLAMDLFTFFLCFFHCINLDKINIYIDYFIMKLKL